MKPEESLLEALTSHYILDQRRNPIRVDLMEWAFWFERFENRLLARTHIGETAEVTTIFMGIGYELFESRLLWLKSEVPPEFLRYDTYAEAMKGHERLAQRAKEGYNWEQSRLRDLHGEHLQINDTRS